jgi:hypothetical protein
MRVWRASLALLLLPGCLGNPGGADLAPEMPEPVLVDSWGESMRQVLMDVDGESLQLDVLCIFGGGVEMPRAEGRVLAGTGHVEALVASPATDTGAQLGYVITTEPGYDERLQDGITWLEPVANGERRFTLPVRDDQIEAPEGPMLWHFYLRMNVPTGENQPKAPCYTGVHYGNLVLRAEAVRVE